MTISTIGDQCDVVAQNEDAIKYRNIIFVNSTGAFIFECLKNDCTIEFLALKLVSKYNIDKDTALYEIESFLQKLKELDIMES